MTMGLLYLHNMHRQPVRKSLLRFELQGRSQGITNGESEQAATIAVSDLHAFAFLVLEHQHILSILLFSSICEINYVTST
jgi:hypothetical protein